MNLYAELFALSGDTQRPLEVLIAALAQVNRAYPAVPITAFKCLRAQLETLTLTEQQRTIDTLAEQWRTS